MNKWFVFLMLLISFSGVASECIWTGAGADSNWTTADNWGGTAPVAGDTLVFSGSTRLDNNNNFPAGTSFGSIKFSSGAGSFILNGNQITLTGDILSEDGSSRTINLPIELSSDTTVSNNVGRIVLNGHISGSGGIIKDGIEYLQITASNSYDGATLIKRGYLEINDAYACGSTNGITTVNRAESGTGALYVNGDGMDIYESLEFRNGGYDGSCFYNRGGSNTLHSTFSLETGRFSYGGTAIVFKGDVSPIGNPAMVLNGGADVIFDGKVNLGSGGGFYPDQPQKIYLNVSSNIWSLTTLAACELIMNTFDALPGNSSLRVGLNYQPKGTLNLNGYDQTIKRMYNGTAFTVAGGRIITSETPAILTLTDSGTETVEVDFQGAAGLKKGGVGTLTLTGTDSDTTGSFIVDEGILTIADGSSLGNSTNIVVNGGSLHIEGNAALATTANLSINGSGYMNIDSNLYVVIDTLFIDDVEQSPGEWGSTASGADNIDDIHFQGEGMLIVTALSSANVSNAVWDAGAADKNISSADNWEGDVAPAFAGFDNLIFGSGGSSSVVDSVVSAYSMIFNRTADFTLADGAGELVLGVGGILAESTDQASRTYSIEEDIEINAFSSTLEINRNGASSVVLDISGNVSSAAWLDETRVTGDGRVDLSGDNSFAGNFIVETGCVVNIYHSNALGSTNGSTTVEYGAYMQMYGGINVAEDITINGDSVVNYNGVLRCNGGSNVLSGVLHCPGSRVRVYSGSLDILGGVTHGSFIAGANSGTFIRVAEKPISIGGANFYPHSSGPVIIAVTNNFAAEANVNGSQLRFDVPNAFNNNIRWDISNNGGTVNLNGNDQEIGRLYTRSDTPSPGTGRVYSDTPATLTVNQSADKDYRNAFEGALSVVKKGASELRLYDSSSTTGTLTVVEGTLTMKTGSSFDAVPLVSVTGGTLALEDETCLSNAAQISIADSGVIDISAGLTEEVGELFIDGSQQRAGTWGATGSGALHIDNAHFSGTGVLKVLHDNSGTVIIVH